MSTNSLYLVEYILRGRTKPGWASRVVKQCILDVEDELDDREDFCCDHILVDKADDGELHLYMYWVNINWKPGEVYERMLRERLLKEGCELELVSPSPNS